MKSLFTLLVSVSLLLFMVSAPGCKKDDDEPKTEVCGNGIDDDGDGFIDCLDFDCDGTSGC